MAEPIRSLRLPEAQEHEIVIIRLDDGRVIARTRRELEEALKAGEVKT